jgi:phosphoribosylaminoimidazolecarboxamide formyltransferase / IMP cyclohydrolase
MNNLLQFLVKHIPWFVFIIYVIISCVLLFSNNPFQQSVYLSSANGISATVYEGYSGVSSYFGLKSVNEALAILKQKKNRVILVMKDFKVPAMQCRTVLNGALVQERDTHVETPEELQQCTTKGVTPEQVADLLFANKVVKHSKSNSIVLAKNKMLIASGVGETSRVDALKHAIEKAHNFKHDLHGAVMASDAFFPFADCVEIAHKEGVDAVIQPGGSVRDGESIDYCNNNGVAMVMTGYRHFKH